MVESKKAKFSRILGHLKSICSFEILNLIWITREAWANRTKDPKCVFPPAVNLELALKMCIPFCHFQDNKPSLSVASLWTETHSRSINMQKIIGPNIQSSWRSIEDTIFCGTQQVIPWGHGSPLGQLITVQHLIHLASSFFFSGKILRHGSRRLRISTQAQEIK